NRQQRSTLQPRALSVITGMAGGGRSTGKHEDTRFEPALFKNEIHSRAPKVTYFWKGRYPKEDIDNFPDSGKVRLDQFNNDARGNIFKVTLITEEVMP
ncbi:hypothetical protein VDP28_04635, partial [Xanthomonas campestris pv. campestris]|nr:hypothetical protein [Xanthomonas campestris pv. aberrans]MCC5078364.1 hypothetical protein [Xanthomonas campestris pv. campestris]MEA9472483.1 hypothetical protein [Xanthomonas campestris]MDM7683487.1 hypothetical protein [Xanthomonas campestris pv. campestris]MDM7687553.1 hypothetical protein [Xanthomonas campestris pv. campestris]